MSVNVHRENTGFVGYVNDPEYVEVGTTMSGERVTFERVADICGKTGEADTEAWTYKYGEHTITHHDVCRLSPGHDGDCSNDVTITDCCDRRVRAEDSGDETVSNPEVTVCNYGHGCNKNEVPGY